MKDKPTPPPLRYSRDDGVPCPVAQLIAQERRDAAMWWRCAAIVSTTVACVLLVAGLVQING